MVQKRRKAPTPRKRRSWTIAKLLLIIGYGIVFAFLGIIFLMRQELFRVGIFGDKPAVHTPVPAPAPPPRVTTEPQRSAPLSSPRVAKELQRQPPTSSPPTSSAAQHPGEITADEKKALDDILRSKR
jgi:hypothetical protein